MESTSPLIDMEFGITQLSGNRDLYITLLGKFSDEYRELNDKLQAMMARSEFDSAYTLMHTLKGVSANLGLTALHHASKQVEIAIRGNQALPEDYSGFVIILDRTLAQIAALSPSAETSDIPHAETAETSAKTALLKALKANEFIPQAQLDSYLKGLNCSEQERQLLTNAIEELDYQEAIAILTRNS